MERRQVLDKYKRQCGTNASTSNLIATVNRTFPLFIGRICNETTKEKLQEYLETKFKTKPTGLTKVQLKHNHFSSYFCYINVLEKEIADNKSNWEQGLIIGRYNAPRESRPAPATIPSSHSSTSTVDPASTTPHLHENNDIHIEITNTFSSLDDNAMNTENSSSSTSNQQEFQ